MTVTSTPTDFKQPVLEYDNSLKGFVTVQPYIYEYGTDKFLTRIKIPAGQVYDKASIPSVLHFLARPDGPVEGPALIHDMFYVFKGKLPKGWVVVVSNQVEYKDNLQLLALEKEDNIPWSREQADKLFRKMCIEAGLPVWRANSYYHSVRHYPPNWFLGW